jgi:ABC-type nitrate/sulfonate/bicarbonate transport system permease component
MPGAGMMGRARGFLVPVLLIVLWELGGRAGILPEDTMSRPSLALVAGWEALSDGTLLVATVETFQAALAGLAIGSAIGIGIGVPLGLSPVAEAVIGPTLDTIRPVPSLALLPLALLIYGFGARMEIMVVAFACTWPVLIVTVSAVRGIDGRLIEIARMLEMSWFRAMARIALPAAMARIGVGVRVAAGIALIVSVTTEIVLNPRGLGYGMMVASQSLRPDLMWAELFWVGLVGFAFDAILRKIDRTWLARYSTVTGR